MDPGLAAFVLIIMAMMMVTAIITTSIQARAKAAASGTEERQVTHAMEQENAGLKRQVRHLEQRIAVLERIATDPAERTAREIENLR